MIILESIEQLQTHLNGIRQKGKSIGFVPTMGNLHAGHIQLVKTAKKNADCVVVSLFVNPTQFGANEDLASYPRTLQDDIDKLQAVNTDVLFTPNNEMIYPRGGENTSYVHVPELTSLHCGAARPGHFDGVTTVVTKLFNMTQPNIAVFGEKDFQQLAVIRRMVADLNIPIKIIGEPIVREADGLAMSSRNGYLNTEQRRLAPQLQQVLINTKQEILAGNREYSNLQEQAKNKLLNQGFKPDYFTICQADSLAEANTSDTQLVILAAAFIGTTRLIDNLTVNIK